MSNRLDLNQQEKIRRKYHEHPLLKACQSAFLNYQAGMNMLLFSPVEVFVEAVDVIDTLFEEGTDREAFICGLWNTLTIKYKLWLPGTPNEEVQTAVCSVFYAAAVTLSVCDEPYFKDDVKEALLDEVYKHKSIVRQEEDAVIVRLALFADELKEWMSAYEVSDAYLSEDIDDVAHDRKPRSILKFVLPKTQSKRNNNHKRPKADYSKFSFELKPKGRFKDKKDKATELLHRELTAKKLIMDVKDLVIKEDFSQLLNIEEKNKLVFNAVFSGADTEYYIVWIGTAKALGYFINQLEERGALTWKEGPRKWQVTRNRIWQRKRETEIDEATGKKQYRYDIVPFKENAFDKNLVPADTSKLDSILDLIAPVEKKMNTRIGNEIADEFRSYSDFEKENDNDRGEKLSKGYRDISHKGIE